jgi:hypothetical protein
MLVNIEHFRRLHDVAKGIVDSGTADAALAAALESAMVALVSQYPDPEHALKTLYAGDTELSSDLRQAVAIVGKDDDLFGGVAIVEKARTRDHVGVRGLGAAVTDHLLDRLADLRRRHGFAKSATEESPMDIEKLKTERMENLLTIGKNGGAVALAKILVADDSAHGITEPEFAQIVTLHAQKLYPDKTPDAAFAKAFSDNSADAMKLRKAHAVVRAGQFAGGAYPYPR